jgi:hypothetical protein
MINNITRNWRREMNRVMSISLVVASFIFSENAFADEKNKPVGTDAGVMNVDVISDRQINDSKKTKITEKQDAGKKDAGKKDEEPECD